VTDIERLREEYRNWWSATEGWTRLEGAQKADALIAALGDEIAELTGQNIDLEVWRASAVKRAEQAEAELQTIKDEKWSAIEALQDLAAAREEARKWHDVAWALAVRVEAESFKQLQMDPESYKAAINAEASTLLVQCEMGWLEDNRTDEPEATP